MTAKEISLDENGFATEAGFITVYSYDGETREFISSSVEYLPVGVGVPGNSCVDAPISKKDGFAVCRTADLTGWEYVADHRGETVYSTETGQEVTISDIGDYPENTTTKAPSTQFDKWIDGKWVTDASEQNESIALSNTQQKAALILEASNYIAPLIDARDGGYIEDNDVPVLAAWQKYRYALTKVDPAKPVWPERPAS